MIKKKNINELKWYNFVTLIVAGIVNATGVALFLIPSGILDGGFSGTAILLNNITGVYVSLFIVGINLPFFIFGTRRLGPAFIVGSLIAIFTYAAMAYLYISVFKFSEAVYDMLARDIILAAVFGGLLSGVGSGLTIRGGGAMDGVEVMAVVFAKRLGFTVGQFVMLYNIVIYIIASIALNDLRIGLYSIITYTVGLRAVDFVVEGFDRAKACIIVTQKGEEMSSRISEELGRGITLLDSRGFYSNECRTMVYCVVNRFEIGKLKKIVAEVDSSAFVTISEISETVSRTDVRFRKKTIAVNNLEPIDRQNTAKDIAQINKDKDIDDKG